MTFNDFIWQVRLSIWVNTDILDPESHDNYPPDPAFLCSPFLVLLIDDGDHVTFHVRGRYQGHLGLGWRQSR